MSENVIILIRISLQFVPMDAIDNKPALVQVMAWCRKGDNPLHEPMLAQFTDKTRQDETRRDETRRDVTRRDKTRQDKTSFIYSRVKTTDNISSKSY